LTKALDSKLEKGVRCIGVTTVPLVAELVGVLPVERWIYYCVDDLSQWPGLDKTSLQSLEEELVRRVDAVVVASERLAERISLMGRSASLLTHGVDLDHWARSSGDSIRQLERLPRPLIVFWGLVDRRLEVPWLQLLSEDLKSGSIVLVGPTNDPDHTIESMARVIRIGALEYRDLPRVAQLASVLIMPYADLPGTRSMQPLKLKEYLATGKPCVVSALPAVEEWQDACDVVATAEDFSQRVLKRLETGLPAPQVAARARLVHESWQRKAQIFERILLGRSTGGMEPRS
jgi:glycosyltransferase involved in cell wall biosynthesis